VRVEEEEFMDANGQLLKKKTVTKTIIIEKDTIHGVEPNQQYLDDVNQNNDGLTTQLNDSQIII
jgi:hypothetical protein